MSREMKSGSSKTKAIIGEFKEYWYCKIPINIRDTIPAKVAVSALLSIYIGYLVACGTADLVLRKVLRE